MKKLLVTFCLLSLASCGMTVPESKTVFKNDFIYWGYDETTQFIKNGNYHFEYDGTYSYSMSFKDGTYESDRGTYVFFGGGFRITNEGGQERTLNMCQLGSTLSYYEFYDTYSFSKEGETPKDYHVIFHATKIFE